MRSLPADSFTAKVGKYKKFGLSFPCPLCDRDSTPHSRAAGQQNMDATTLAVREFTYLSFSSTFGEPPLFCPILLLHDSNMRRLFSHWSLSVPGHIRHRMCAGNTVSSRRRCTLKFRRSTSIIRNIQKTRYGSRSLLAPSGLCTERKVCIDSVNLMIEQGHAHFGHHLRLVFWF